MISFIKYLEEAKESMIGNIGTERKGIRHLQNYVLPYLSAEQRQHVARNFSKHISPGKIKIEHGEQYNSDPNVTTHKLATDANGFSAGTPVRVTGARHDDEGRVLLQTANHGEIQQSKLLKPEELKREQITKGGFDVESKIAKNLGTQAAGSTGTAYDYSYRGKEGGIQGKARKLETDSPYLRGESKQNKAKMGESAIKYDKASKTWSFTHPKLAQKFAEARHPASGLSVLEHLNKYHSNGIIQRGMTIPAPAGMTRSYLGNLGVNSLHLHRTEKAKGNKPAIDHGTTYTIGDSEIRGKTNLSHLNPEDIDKLDGSLSIEATTNGATKIAHKPKFGVFREYADNSVTNPSQHGDLSREDHAALFKHHTDKHLDKTKNKPKKAPAPIKPADRLKKTTMGGKNFYSDSEL